MKQGMEVKTEKTERKRAGYEGTGMIGTGTFRNMPFVNKGRGI